MAQETEATTLKERVAQLERSFAALRDEVRTRRLVVTDPEGAERIVGHVNAGTAELKVVQPGCPHGEITGAVIFATPGDETYDLGGGIGVQHWMAGNLAHDRSFWTDDES